MVSARRGALLALALGEQARSGRLGFTQSLPSPGIHLAAGAGAALPHPLCTPYNRTREQERDCSSVLTLGLLSIQLEHFALL